MITGFSIYLPSAYLFRSKEYQRHDENCDHDYIVLLILNQDKVPGLRSEIERLGGTSAVAKNLGLTMSRSQA